MRELIEMLSEIKVRCGRYHVRTFSFAWWTILLGGIALVCSFFWWTYIGTCTFYIELIG